MMTSNEVGEVLLAVSVLLAGAHFFGYVCVKLRQPRLIGEILAGIVLGPFLLGRIAPGLFEGFFGAAGEGSQVQVVLGFIYWFGLMLLMFISGSQVRRVLAHENRQETAWILGIGTPLPFFLVLFLGLANVLPIDPLVGPQGHRISALLILAIAVAVTSIPVISRIFYDLKILHTRFASLILGAAVLEDIILWVVLAVATALAGTTAMLQEQVIGQITSHVGATLIYTTLALFLTPRIIKFLHRTRWNVLRKTSKVGYLILILFVYAIIATLLEVNLVFAAFLAGFGVVGGFSGSERERFSKFFEAIEQFSTSTFIPIYFAIVGYRLVFGSDFSMLMLVAFLAGSSLLSLLSVGLAARLANFKGLDIVNIAITTNARGGPGIVLASVAYDAGLINAAFYTTLVLAAVFTSQAAGVWLRFVLSRGWPLLSSNPEETWKPAPKPRTQRELPAADVDLARAADLQRPGD